MLYKLQCTVDALHKRTGPSTSHKIVGMLYKGDTIIVDEIKKYSNGGYWYKHKGSNIWSCCKTSGKAKIYLKVIENLEKPKVEPPKTEAPPKPKDSGNKVDYDEVRNALNKRNNKGRLAPYDVKYQYQFEKGEENKDIGEDILLPKNTNNDNNALGNGRIRTYDLNQLSREGTELIGAKPEDILKQIKTIKKNLNIGGRWTDGSDLRNDLFEYCNRFNIEFPEDQLAKSFGVVFFTRPDLNLLDSDGKSLHPQIASDPALSLLWKRNPKLLQTLTGGFSTSHNFLPYLCTKAKSIDIPDEVIQTKEVGVNFVGYKVLYGMNNHESLTAGTFNVEYQDDRDLTVYNIHKVWVDYISGVFKGALAPKLEYIHERVIDYAASCYYFLMSEDGESIIFGHKYTGIFPNNVPSSTFSWTNGDSLSLPKFTVQYSYWFRESLNLTMLGDFNTMCNQPKNSISIYSDKLGHCGDTITGMPFVSIDMGLRNPFKLKYRPIN